MKIKLLIVLTILVARSIYATPVITCSDTPHEGAFPLITASEATQIVVDSHDAKVVHICATLLAADVERVTGKKPFVTGDEKTKPGVALIIGSLGHSKLIDDLVAQRRLDVSSIKDKWEAYLITAIDNPAPELSKAIVIVGGDRRGTAYGVFTLSEAIGVSPWYWWADVTPRKRSQLYIRIPSPVTDAPAVKYRGIFINDEDWGLLPWATTTFDTESKSIGPKTYAKVFELMLRLKANYLWPAMHPKTRAFNYFPQNKRLADDYGIVMSSSHAEPMLRNNTTEYDITKRGPWDYDKNRDGIYQYWNERVRENRQYENVYTIGMRGIHDSAMPGGGSTKEKVTRLQHVLDDQRAIISNNINVDASKVPQQFVPYKEVLPLYQHGLKVPNDVTLVWPDDNFGYIRRLSTPEEQKRTGCRHLLSSFLLRPTRRLSLA